LIKKYCLVGEVNGDGILQIDIPLASAIQRANALSGISFLGLGDRKKRLGVFIGILHTHATMTVSA
jgi:hypothetical protein